MLSVIGSVNEMMLNCSFNGQASNRNDTLDDALCLMRGRDGMYRWSCQDAVNVHAGKYIRLRTALIKKCGP
jgi:hypothetical protein